jgi:hypothetical protein
MSETDLIRMSEKSPATLNTLNLRGLTKPQVSLYKYIKLCADENKIVDILKVAEIYYNEVRNPEKPYLNQWWLESSSIPEERKRLKNKDVFQYYTHPERASLRKWYIEIPAKNWLKQNIGSLVLRGFFTILPAFDPELTKE